MYSIASSFGVLGLRYNLLQIGLGFDCNLSTLRLRASIIGVLEEYNLPPNTECSKTEDNLAMR